MKALNKSLKLGSGLAQSLGADAELSDLVVVAKDVITNDQSATALSRTGPD